MMPRWTLDDLPPDMRAQALAKLRDDPVTRDAQRRMTEKDWQDRVTGILRRHGWITYHTWNSRKSAPGFPDLVALRNREADPDALARAATIGKPDAFAALLTATPAGGADVLVAELKRVGGTITREQRAWLALFHLAGIPTFVWTPSHEEAVETVARQGDIPHAGP